jgi:hypothetical protein
VADDGAVQQARTIMARFAERTGLTSDRQPRRYLWTDAFAVCNFLALARRTGEGRYTELALALVAQVHRVLGQHRADESRTGWLSGLEAQAGEAHPTRGGLRIGKPLPERTAGEPMDERLEWDRDGQYFHYLTKWMHALDQVSRATGQALFGVWARELAEAAHRAFTYEPAGGGRKRMYWKMSVDLTRPLVASMGHHDPLDGLVTCVQLAATSVRLPSAGPDLGVAVRDFSTMLDRRHLATADPLGLGGLLIDAHRVAQLMRVGAWPRGDDLLEPLLAASLAGLRAYVAGPDLRAPVERRLAFRELGLAIGLSAVARMAEDAGHGSVRLPGSATARAILDEIARHLPLRTHIEAAWLPDAHRATRVWREHEDINDVMLATALVPEGFLTLD